MRIKQHSHSWLTIFLFCRRRYYYALRWKEKGVSLPLEIGKAVHEALSHAKDPDLAYEKLLKVSGKIKKVEDREKVEDASLQLFTLYLEEYQDNILETVEEEIFFEWRLDPKLALYKGRIDALHKRDEKILVLERKTTSSTLSSFFDAYEINRQILGYAAWTKEKHSNFGGVIVDALSRETSRHGPNFERRIFHIKETEIEAWKRETCLLITDVERAAEGGKDAFYKNPSACKVYYGKCPFFEACIEDNERYLEFTHERKNASCLGEE